MHKSIVFLFNVLKVFF